MTFEIFMGRRRHSVKDLKTIIRVRVLEDYLFSPNGPTPEDGYVMGDERYGWPVPNIVRAAILMEDL